MSREGLGDKINNPGEKICFAGEFWLKFNVGKTLIPGRGLKLVPDQENEVETGKVGKTLIPGRGLKRYR